MKYLILIAVMITSGITQAKNNPATVKEVETELKTYNYSNPREYLENGRIYPYYRFDGFSEKGVMKKWKMIELENDYIKVVIAPEIGGKIWGAIDKKTGKEFIYFNHVVKFRDVSSRGPWTSGGVEMNFGVIGHSPWCSSNVDYKILTKPDGSVSCIVGGTDISLGTEWLVEISLPADKALFETKVLWYNGTSMEKPFYHWMNAGIKTSGDLQYYFPGTGYLTHDGRPMPWPVEEQHRIDRYEENNFGHYKSYHIFGKVTDYWGTYWHKDSFGMLHSSPYFDKLGKKIWIWGLSRYGMVWKDLLTDNDDQYSEVQSGKLFNQSIGTSYKTPFKHYSLMPGQSISWSEYWFPFQKIGGIDFSSTELVGFWDTAKGKSVLNLYAPAAFEKELKVFTLGKEVYSSLLKMNTADTVSFALNTLIDKNNYRVQLGKEIIYTTELNNQALTRPTVLSSDFNQESAYGLYLQGKEFERQNFFDKAEHLYRNSLSKEPFFIPSLVGLAGICFQQNRITESDQLIRKALQVNTYDPDANYLYAQIALKQKREADAIDGFSVAKLNMNLSGEAARELALIYMRKECFDQPLTLINKSLSTHPMNIRARELYITCLRLAGKKEQAQKELQNLNAIDPLNKIAHYEQYILSGKSLDLQELKKQINNEFNYESYLAMSAYYENTGQLQEAINVLEQAPINPMVLYNKAWLLNKTGSDNAALTLLNKADSMSPSLIYPHANTDEDLFLWVKSTGRSAWKADYYLALLYFHFNRIDEASTLLKSCGDKPDFYAFYLTRGMQVTKNESDFQKAIKLSPDNFVCYLEAARNNLASGQSMKAIEVLKQYNKKDSENSYINLLLANAYLQNKNYKEGILLLESICVLPNEGSLAGRNVWRECNLYNAIDLINQHHYKEALKYIQNARLWPENLGVGKPYENCVDERLEDVLEWYAYEESKRDNHELLNKLVNYPVMNFPYSSTNVFTFILMKNADKNNQVAGELNNWKKGMTDDQTLLWCEAILNDQWTKATEIQQQPIKQIQPLPFEVPFIDYDFKIIVANYDLFTEIIKELKKLSNV